MLNSGHTLPARRFLCAVLAVACAITTSPGRGQNPLQLEQIKQHELKLAESRAAKDQKEEAQQLLDLGAVYSEAGKKEKALEYDNQGLTISRDQKLRSIEAAALNDIGSVYSDLGQKQKALEFLNQALPIRREVRDRKGEAATLDSIGGVYSDQGQMEKSLEYFSQALPIRREVGDRGGEATTLDNLAEAYMYQGQMPKAMEYLNQALPMQRELGDRGGEATTLNDLGFAYDDLGQKQQALDYYSRGLVALREVGDRGHEAIELSNIGTIYRGLGQQQSALEYFTQALPILREVGDRGGEGTILSNIGTIYRSLGQQEKALEYLNQAVVINREVGDRKGEATTLDNIGGVYGDLGQSQKSLEVFTEILPIRREVKDRAGEGITLSDIGFVYFQLGQFQKALEYSNRALAALREVGDRQHEVSALVNIGYIDNQLGDAGGALRNQVAALSLAKAVKDPNLQGGIDASLMSYFSDQEKPEAAILFGMDAVNCFQQMRRNITGLEKDLQASFAQSKSNTYRQLAELLVQSDRLGEAEQVLDLLKEQELKEVVRGGATDTAAKVEPLKLSASQQQAEDDLVTLDKTADDLTGLSLEYATLLAKTARTGEEETRLKVLDASIEAGNGEVAGFFQKTLYPELAQRTSVQDANALLSKEKSEVSRLQNTLAELGPGVMGIRLLLGQEHAYAIVVTAKARRKFVLTATPAELREKVLQVRDDLRSPASSPKPHLAELYAMVVAPLEQELKALELSKANNGATRDRAPTLLWSLDGVLRYVPIAALYDGRRYMVERFNNVLFTPESYGHMISSSAQPAAKLNVLAMGLSKSYGGLPALPGVLPELDAVVHDPAVPESHGPIEGKLLPNEQFTLAALKTELGAGKSFSVVHIASHFVEDAASGDEPYLMLGGENAGGSEGYALTLSRIEDSTISFHGTQLLTLSACSTAKGDAAKDGMEMDSLGMIAQQKDAEAVLATLWDVNDASTSRLMSDFYSQWVKHPADGKAEALRQAQLGLLRASATSQSDAVKDRGVEMTHPAASGSHLSGNSHPYYWAPFVLIGNYQ
jgi:CHAT domain-containing protein/Tfp pilus assembly protein PilF